MARDQMKCLKLPLGVDLDPERLILRGELDVATDDTLVPERLRALLVGVCIVALGYYCRGVGVRGLDSEVCFGTD